MKKKKKSGKLKLFINVLLGAVFFISSILYMFFYNEVNTLLSIRKINGKPAYKITYHGDYALDKYLNTGAENWNEVLNFINENLSRGVGRYIYGTSRCSSFFAKTTEGDYILGRNLDTTEAIPSIIKTDTKNGYKTIGVTNFSRGGWDEKSIMSKLTAISSPYFTLDGMNEYGLAIASLSVPDYTTPMVDEDKKTIHDITVDRVVIDSARSVKEAVAFLSNFNVKMEKTYPSHYMVADSEGNSAVIEYIDGEMKVIEGNGDYQIATNFTLYNNKELLGYSSGRYMAFDKVLSQTNGVITVEAALDLLEDNVVPGEAQWSVVYNLTKKTMAIEFYNDYDNTYYFSIDD